MAVYTISNNKISISVNSFGAELTSLKSSGTELLWQADKSVWARHAPVLFPIVGKLKENKFKYKDSDYTLTQHGFARDKEFVLVGQSESSLEFKLTASNETLKIFPFNFSLRIRYELESNGVNIKYIVFNPGEEELFFSLGAHPGFNCKRVELESLQDFYLEFENKKELMVEKLKDGLLMDETYEIKLIGNKLPLNVNLFDKDALVFKNTQIEEVKLCSIKSKTKIIFRCKDWPYFGIWTKKGSDAFVCLEPWYGIADSVNANVDISTKEGILSLKPSGSFEAGFSIEIVS